MKKEVFEIKTSGAGSGFYSYGTRKEIIDDYSKFYCFDEKDIASFISGTEDEVAEKWLDTIAYIRVADISELIQDRDNLTKVLEEYNKDN